MMEHDEMRRLTDDELYELRDIVACTAKTAQLYLEPERGNQVASILREVTELRATLAERDAKIRELHGWVDGQLIPLSVELMKSMDDGSPWDVTKATGDAYASVIYKMAELGLIVED